MTNRPNMEDLKNGRRFSRKKGRILIKYLVRLLIVGITGWFMYYTANHNNRRPTLTDGSWQLTKTTDSVIDIPERIYFERNRAWMAVFRYHNRWETNHFEMLPAKDSIYMYEGWMIKRKLIFSGKYAIKDSTLQLSGVWQRQPITLLLLKRDHR